MFNPIENAIYEIVIVEPNTVLIRGDRSVDRVKFEKIDFDNDSFIITTKQAKYIFITQGDLSYRWKFSHTEYTHPLWSYLNKEVNIFIRDGYCRIYPKNILMKPIFFSNCEVSSFDSIPGGSITLITEKYIIEIENFIIKDITMRGEE